MISRDNFPVQPLLRTIQQSSLVRIDPKSPNIALATISLVQKLHNMNVVKSEDQIQLLECLYVMRDSQDDQIQLRLT